MDMVWELNSLGSTLARVLSSMSFNNIALPNRNSNLPSDLLKPENGTASSQDHFVALKVLVLADNLEVGELLLLEAGVEVEAHCLAHHLLLLLLHLVADVSHLTKSWIVSNHLCKSSLDPILTSEDKPSPTIIGKLKPTPRTKYNLSHPQDKSFFTLLRGNILLSET